MPTISGLSRSQISFDDLLGVSGSGLDMTGTDVNVTVGSDGVECALVSRSDSEIVCRLGKGSGLMAGVEHDVRVLVRNVGYALQTERLTVRFVPRLTGLSGRVGSTAGGSRLEVYGDGFRAEATVVRIGEAVYQNGRGAKVSFGTIMMESLVGQQKGTYAVEVFVNGVRAESGAERDSDQQGSNSSLTSGEIDSTDSFTTTGEMESTESSFSSTDDSTASFTNTGEMESTESSFSSTDDLTTSFTTTGGIESTESRFSSTDDSTTSFTTTGEMESTESSFSSTDDSTTSFTTTGGMESTESSFSSTDDSTNSFTTTGEMESTESSFSSTDDSTNSYLSTGEMDSTTSIPQTRDGFDSTISFLTTSSEEGTSSSTLNTGVIDSTESSFSSTDDSTNSYLSTGETDSATSSITTVQLRKRRSIADSSLFEFTFSDQFTPLLSSVNPSSINASTTLLITGTLFGTNASQVSVSIGPETCQVTSLTDTALYCHIQGLPVGNHTLSVNILGLGKALGTLFVTSSLNVQALHPTLGSIYGGAWVTVTGNGFTPDTTVFFGDYVCMDVHTSSSEVFCRTSNSATADVSLGIRLSSNGEMFSSSIGFTYSSSVTPVISAARLTWPTLTLDGSGFGTSTADVQVRSAADIFFTFIVKISKRSL